MAMNQQETFDWLVSENKRLASRVEELERENVELALRLGRMSTEKQVNEESGGEVKIPPRR